MIYGPYIVRDLDAEPTVLTSGPYTSTVYPPLAGEHYTVDAGFFAQHAETLAPYRVSPATSLQHVMAGDDPANPVLTIPLRFPDAGTAEAVLAAVLPTDEDV